MNISMVQIILSNRCIYIVLLYMIGFGVHHGYVGIRHSTGIIGQRGGIHTIASLIICIGIIAIGTTIIILSAPIVQVITTMRIIVLCVKR